jgi:hypothetical protein
MATRAGEALPPVLLAAGPARDGGYRRRCGGKGGETCNRHVDED